VVRFPLSAFSLSAFQRFSFSPSVFLPEQLETTIRRLDAPTTPAPLPAQPIKNKSQLAFRRFSLALSDKVATILPEGSPHWK
jgi:hypothetical protein